MSERDTAAGRFGSMLRLLADLTVRIVPVLLLVAWGPYLLYLGAEGERIAAQAHYGWFAVESMQAAAVVGGAVAAVVWAYLVLPAGARAVAGVLATLVASAAVAFMPHPDMDGEDLVATFNERVDAGVEGLRAGVLTAELPRDEHRPGIGSLPPPRYGALSGDPVRAFDFKGGDYLNGLTMTDIRGRYKGDLFPSPGRREESYEYGYHKRPLGNERVHDPAMQRDLRLTAYANGYRSYCENQWKRIEKQIALRKDAIASMADDVAQQLLEEREDVGKLGVDSADSGYRD